MVLVEVEVEIIHQEEVETLLLQLLLKDFPEEMEFLQDLIMVVEEEVVQVLQVIMVLLLKEEMVELELIVQLTDHLVQELEVVEVALMLVQELDLEDQVAVAIQTIMVKQKPVAELEVL